MTTKKLMFRVKWIFRNGHEWYKLFDTREEAEHFVNRCGLAIYPDITFLCIDCIDQYSPNDE